MESTVIGSATRKLFAPSTPVEVCPMLKLVPLVIAPMILPVFITNKDPVLLNVSGAIGKVKLPLVTFIEPAFVIVNGVPPPDEGAYAPVKYNVPADRICTLPDVGIFVPATDKIPC